MSPDKIALSISPHFYNKENRAPERKSKDGKMSNAYAHAAFQTVSVDPAFIVRHITSGKAISVSAVTGDWRREDNFISSQLMGVDLDESPGIDALFEDQFVREYAFLAYPTPSHTEQAPRSRVLFILDQPLTDKERYKLLVKRLMHRFAVPLDESCKDAARVFYGSDKPGYRANEAARLPLAVLDALPQHPDELKPPPAERQATVIDDYRTRKRAESWALKTKQNIFDAALAVPTGAGQRHKAFNAAAMEAVAKAKGGWIGFESIDSELRWLGIQMGRDEDEIERGIRGAWTKAEAQALVLPKDDREQPPKPTLVSEGNGHAKPYTPNPAPAALTWKTSDDAVDLYIERIKRGRGDNKLPIIFPLKPLHKFGGFCHVLPRGVLVGVVGMSGGTKTSFTESITEPLRQLGEHGIWWGIEWSWDMMLYRAVQRHGGATVTESILHEMALDEEANNITQKRFGVRMASSLEDKSVQIAKTIRTWKGKSHQIEQAATNIEDILEASAARVDELKVQGIEVSYAVFDYMQLLDIYSKMSEAERNTTILGKIKQFCIAHQLVGFVVSQVTKAGANNAKSGEKVLEAEAGQFLRSDKFNLVLTLNPVYAGGLITDQAVINVAKNSLGSTGTEWLYINPARLLWTDKVVPDEKRIKETEEVVF